MSSRQRLCVAFPFKQVAVGLCLMGVGTWRARGCPERCSGGQCVVVKSLEVDGVESSRVVYDGPE
jgi:hypothetical protein